LVGGPARIRT